MNTTVRKNIQVWVIVAILLGLQFCIHSIGFSSEKKDVSWTSIEVKDGGCQIAFPVVPQKIQQSLQISEAGQNLYYDVYLAPFRDEGVFLLLVATYPVPLTEGHEVAGLEGLLKGILTHHSDNKLVFANVLDIHGRPAINFLIQSGTSYFRGQALMVGTKLYLMAMEGKKGSLDEPTFNQFIQSFQLHETGVEKNLKAKK